MPSNSAEYMREYRKRRKGENLERLTLTRPGGEPIEFFGPPHEIIAQATERILALEEEVARLKRLLAERQPVAPDLQRRLDESGLLNAPIALRDNSFAEFRPAPKPSSQKHR